MQTFPLTVKCDYNLRGQMCSRFAACFSFYCHPTWVFEFNRNKVRLIKSKDSSFKYTARVLVSTDIIWDQHACRKKRGWGGGSGKKPVHKRLCNFFFLLFFCFFVLHRLEFILRRAEHCIWSKASLTTVSPPTGPLRWM